MSWLEKQAAIKPSATALTNETTVPAPSGQESTVQATSNTLRDAQVIACATTVYTRACITRLNSLGLG